MSEKIKRIDRVGPSRDGHEFHEAWAARKAMQLILPRDGLIGIAVEGLSKDDEINASNASVEIADLTMYYGTKALFEDADRVEVLQLKYSPTRADKDFRASDAKKTIEKFAKSYLDYIKNYTNNAVAQKLAFKLITNRPILPALEEAIIAIAQGSSRTGVTKDQADQFTAASGLNGNQLTEFASKCYILGLAGRLPDIKKDLANLLVDWSATSDHLAHARLGEIRDMVRRKAGCEEEPTKLINTIDVLAALDLSGVEELLPCTPRRIDVGEIVEREQLTATVSLVQKLTRPLVIHAEGGVGKTVFLESLEAKLSSHNEIVFFDCFGGGSYRSPDDNRHLPSQGLMHIVNDLACRGLCDPILPGNNDTTRLLRTFRKRISQCSEALSKASPDRKLILIIDAIDNAVEISKERGDGDAFPILLMQSINMGEAVEGVKFIFSGRTHRIKRHLANYEYDEIILNTFTLAETKLFLSSRVSNVTNTEIGAAQTRANGNARILQHLVATGQEWLKSPNQPAPLNLNELLEWRINRALSEAKRQGYNCNPFLAGLAFLPTPIPVDEYALALGINAGAIHSFASDLAPLIHNTPHGMIICDEPTDTYVRDLYGKDKSVLRSVAENLLTRQCESVYAALALPSLLQSLGEGHKLFELALDEKMPSQITSSLGQRRIRYLRIKAAILHATNTGEKEHIVRLLVELSLIESSDKKGSLYISSNPDLAVNTNDYEALRRLYETKTNWPGSRHARLTIASILSGDIEEASAYYEKAEQWIRHEYDSKNDEYNNNVPYKSRPSTIDYASIPFYLLAQHECKNAIEYFHLWLPWYAYEICDYMFRFCAQACRKTLELFTSIDTFLDSLSSDIGLLAAALSFLDLNADKSKFIIENLARACKRNPHLELSNTSNREIRYKLQDGLCKSAMIAVSFNMHDEARAISLRSPHQRPSIADMTSHYDHENTVFSFLFRAALLSASTGKEILERDILPFGLFNLAKGIKRNISGEELISKLKNKNVRNKRKQNTKESGHSELNRDIEQENRFLDTRMTPILELTKAFALFIGSPLNGADKSFLELVDVWLKFRNREDHFYNAQHLNTFFEFLGRKIVVFSLWARDDINEKSATTFLKKINDTCPPSPASLIEIISVVSSRPKLNSLAGELSVSANSLIDKENDTETRTNLYAELSRAILPASSVEAANYFRHGLDQLDAIGSGDYELLNELLFFASSLNGEELNEKDCHTFTNICELNLYEDEERFPAASFATAISRIFGLRGLAKISRWHNRGKLPLDRILLPYLTALVGDDKIKWIDAVALNRLASPIEIEQSNTSILLRAILKKNPHSPEIPTRELIRQYIENNPSLSWGFLVKDLACIAENTLGKTDKTTQYLVDYLDWCGKIEGASKKHRPLLPQKSSEMQRVKQASQKRKIQQIVAETKPPFKNSISAAIQRLHEELPSFRMNEKELFHQLRNVMTLDDRPQYIDAVAHAFDLDVGSKFKELDYCKQLWAKSSLCINEHLHATAFSLIKIHAGDYLSPSMLIHKVSDLTGVQPSELALEMTKLWSRKKESASSSTWLTLASILLRCNPDEQGQESLTKLLNSSSAKLSNSVTDGPWKPELYPENNSDQICAGLVWSMLGSPRGADRWRAAHSLRCFARLGRWSVIDELVNKLKHSKSSAFIASEIPFFNLHASLWLLIALSRISSEDPKQVSRYTETLTEIALNNSRPHAAIRHFAAKTILSCSKGGALDLSVSQVQSLNVVDESALAPAKKSGCFRPDWYRPNSAPKQKYPFNFDYNFEKYDITHLARGFGLNTWEVSDLISEHAHRLDPEAGTSSFTVRRETSYRYQENQLHSGDHEYTQYIAWHAYNYAAAELLNNKPLVSTWNWKEINSNIFLARDDENWLSDGVDWPPFCALVRLLSISENQQIITEEKENLLRLVGIEGNRIEAPLLIRGNWKSVDGIKVHITSALVPSNDGEKYVEILLDEDEYSVWLPTYKYDDDGNEYRNYSDREYIPWIVTSYAEDNNIDTSDLSKSAFLLAT